MKEEQNQLLRLLSKVPARLTAEQTAWVLNCQPHDILVLVTSRLLKPLGNLSLCFGRSVGVGKRPRVISKNDKRCGPAPAEEKCGKEKRRFAPLIVLERDVRGCIMLLRMRTVEYEVLGQK